MSKFTFFFLAGFGCGLLAVPNQAQEAASTVGVVSLARNAMVAEGRLSTGATVFSGDLLKTADRGQVNVQVGSLQFEMGPESAARIFHQGNRTVVEIERGTMLYSAKGSHEDLTLFASDVRLVPKTSVPASGQVSIVSRCQLSVTALHSTVEVSSGKETRTIEENKSFKVLSEMGVDYRDSWRPVLTEYPDFPPDAPYHHSHAHVACSAGVWQTASRSPVKALATGHFAEVVGGAAAVLTGIVLQEALESTDRP